MIETSYVFVIGSLAVLILCLFEFLDTVGWKKAFTFVLIAILSVIGVGMGGGHE